jgi:hypothetical protein
MACSGDETSTQRRYSGAHGAPDAFLQLRFALRVSLRDVRWLDFTGAELYTPWRACHCLRPAALSKRNAAGAHQFVKLTAVASHGGNRPSEHRLAGEFRSVGVFPAEYRE